MISVSAPWPETVRPSSSNPDRDFALGISPTSDRLHDIHEERALRLRDCGNHPIDRIHRPIPCPGLRDQLVRRSRVRPWRSAPDPSRWPHGTISR